jgi:hypothetical protein
LLYHHRKRIVKFWALRTANSSLRVEHL